MVTVGDEGSPLPSAPPLGAGLPHPLSPTTDTPCEICSSPASVSCGGCVLLHLCENEACFVTAHPRAMDRAAHRTLLTPFCETTQTDKLLSATTTLTTTRDTVSTRMEVALSHGFEEKVEDSLRSALQCCLEGQETIGRRGVSVEEGAGRSVLMHAVRSGVDRISDGLFVAEVATVMREIDALQNQPEIDARSIDATLQRIDSIPPPPQTVHYHVDTILAQPCLCYDQISANLSGPFADLHWSPPQDSGPISGGFHVSPCGRYAQCGWSDGVWGVVITSTPLGEGESVRLRLRNSECNARVGVVHSPGNILLPMGSSLKRRVDLTHANSIEFVLDISLRYGVLICTANGVSAEVHVPVGEDVHIACEMRRGTVELL